MSRTQSPPSEPLARPPKSRRKPVLWGLGALVHKRLTVRTLRFLLARHVLARLPGLGPALSLASGRVDPGAISSGRAAPVTSCEELPLGPDEARHLAAYPEWREPPQTLKLERRLVVQVLPDVRVLSSAPQIIHRPSWRVVIPDGWELGRQDLQPARPRRRRRIPGTSVSLLSSPAGHGHYFHFFFDRFLPLFVARDHPALAGEVSLLVRENRPAFQAPAIDRLLDVLSDARLVSVGPDEALDCDLLVGFADQRARLIDQFAFGDAVREIGPLYRAAYGIEESPATRRLYLSRANQRARRMANEEAIAAVLSDLGYETVMPERLSHAEQVALFGEASHIVGITGAAFTNLMFCKPGTRVVEIRPADFRYPLWLGLCLQMRLRHRGMIGSPTDLKRRLSVDPVKLRSLLQEID